MPAELEQDANSPGWAKNPWLVGGTSSGLSVLGMLLLVVLRVPHPETIAETTKRLGRMEQSMARMERSLEVIASNDHPTRAEFVAQQARSAQAVLELRDTVKDLASRVLSLERGR